MLVIMRINYLIYESAVLGIVCVFVSLITRAYRFDMGLYSNCFHLIIIFHISFDVKYNVLNGIMVSLKWAQNLEINQDIKFH